MQSTLPSNLSPSFRAAEGKRGVDSVWYGKDRDDTDLLAQGCLLTQSPASKDDHESSMHSQDFAAGNDNTSSDDDSSTDQSESSVDDPMTLLERRASNMERNKDLLTNLGLAYGHSIALKRPRKKRIQDVEEASQESLTRGMLLSRTLAGSKNIDARSSEQDDLEDTQQRYPHREGQIRKLLGLLNSAAAQKNTFVPAPIFVTGPSGSGKTALVQDVVKVVKKWSGAIDDRGAQMGSAYVDCSALDVASCDHVVRCAYNQFESELEDPTERKAKKRKRQRHKKNHRSGAKGTYRSPLFDVSTV